MLGMAVAKDETKEAVRYRDAVKGRRKNLNFSLTEDTSVYGYHKGGNGEYC